MTIPQVEYRGHVISWSDNEDKWWARDFGFSHQSLAKCRERIDKEYRALRNRSSVKCLKIEGGYSHKPEARDATLVEYLGSKHERLGYQKDSRSVNIHRVAAMYSRGTERLARHQCVLTEFAPDTPEVLAMVAQATEKHEAARALQDEANAILEAIPRLTDADIADLIRAADTKLEGDA